MIMKRTLLFFLISVCVNLPAFAQLVDSLAVTQTELEQVVPMQVEESSAQESEKQSEIVVAKTDRSSATPKVQDIKGLFSFTKIFWSVSFLLLAFFLIRFTVGIIERLAERSTNYRLSIKRLVPVTRVFGWASTIYIVIAAIIQPPFETIITVSASLGIAVGFASQDILKNIFGGIMIILDRPFQVGDKIDVGGHYGEVTQIGLRSVRIVTPDDSVVSLPNGELMNRAVSNTNAGELNCLVVAEVLLPISINTEEARLLAHRAALCSRYIYLNKPITVIIKEEIHNRHFVYKMRIKAYVLDIRYEFPFMSDMAEIMLKESKKRGWINPENDSYVLANQLRSSQE